MAEDTERVSKVLVTDSLILVMIVLDSVPIRRVSFSLLL